MTLPAIVPCLLLWIGPNVGAEPVPRQDHLPSHADVTGALQRIAAGHPSLARVERVGLSRDGRVIEALRVAGQKLPDDAPGILVVANLTGNRLFASDLALEQAKRLTELYAGGGDVRALLDTTVLYFIPAPNPDVAEARFATPLYERLGNGWSVDDDRDGRQGEDPPRDVNGDGLVTWIRVEDPEGTWIEDPTDARVLIEADATKGQRGKYKKLREGLDQDGDELVAEDQDGDTYLNRSFASGWDAHTEHAGLFPSDEPEARALMEFVMMRPHINLVVAYDAWDDLVEKPKSVKDDAPAVKRVPPAGWLESDAALLEELGRRYKEATGSEAKGEPGDEGSFQRWAYDHRGLFVLGMALWDMPTEAPKAEGEDAEEATGEDAEADEGESEQAAGDMAKKGGKGSMGKKDAGMSKKSKEDEPSPSMEAKHLKWVDAAGEQQRFVDWSAFEHPHLGPVEIGGFAPYALVEPPAEAFDELTEKHFDFLLTLGALLPRVHIARCEAQDLGNGVYRVEAVVENAAFLPLLTRSARRTRTTRPARVELELPDAGTLLSGAPMTLISELDGSGGIQELTWLVQGPEGMQMGVRVETDHAGNDRRQAEVVR